MPNLTINNNESNNGTILYGISNDGQSLNACNVINLTLNEYTPLLDEAITLEQRTILMAREKTVNKRAIIDAKNDTIGSALAKLEAAIYMLQSKLYLS